MSLKQQSLWRQPNFMKLWVGQTVSEVGSRITREGLPMAAVLMMGVTPLTMSGLSLMTLLPASIVGLFVGVWVDRLARRPLMVTADLARAFLLVSIPLLALTHHLQLWAFYVVSGLAGMLTLLFDVSYQAYVPWLIQRQNLAEGNRKLSVTSSVAEVIGPGLTGLLVQALTAPIAILFDAGSYVFSALAVWRIDVKERPKRSASQVTHQPAPSWQVLRTEWIEGVHVLLHNRLLLGLAGVAATSGFASSPIYVLDTLYALRTLHLTAFLFGLTVTMGGIGALLGATLCNRFVRRLGVGKTMIVMLLVQGISATAWVFAGGSVWRVMGCLLAWQLFGDLCGTVYGILDLTLRQTLVGDEWLGRINATIRAVEVGVTALGALAAGLLGEVIGIRATMAFAAVGMVAATLWLIWSPIRTLNKMPEV